MKKVIMALLLIVTAMPLTACDIKPSENDLIIDVKPKENNYVELEVTSFVSDGSLLGKYQRLSDDENLIIKGLIFTGGSMQHYYSVAE